MANARFKTDKVDPNVCLRIANERNMRKLVEQDNFDSNFLSPVKWGKDRYQYYISHCYSVNPALSIQIAYQYSFILSNMGKVVFSPVMHTHHYHEEYICKEDQDPPDYVNWDIQLLVNLKHPIMLLDENAFKSINKNLWNSDGCRREYFACKKHGIPVYNLQWFIAGVKAKL